MDSTGAVRHLISVPIIAFLLCRAHAEQGPFELEELVVRSEKSMPGDSVDEDSHPSFVTVIDIDDLASPAFSVSDVLEGVVGVQVSDYGGLGSFSTVSIRGASSDQVLIYLDGVLLNQAAGGAVDLSTIPFSHVSKMEVYRGITPTWLGISAPGGVVNIRTRSPKAGLTGRTSAGYGSFDTFGASAFLSCAGERLSCIVTADHRQSEGDYEFLDDNRTEFNQDDDRTVDRANNDFDEWSTLAKLAYENEPGWRTEVSCHWFQREQGIPGRSNNQSLHARLDTQRLLTAVGLRNAGLAGGRVGLDIDCAYHMLTYAFKDTFGASGEVGLGRQDTENASGTFSTHVLATFDVSSHHKIVLGADHRQERYDPEDRITQGPQPPSSSRKTTGLVLSDEIALLEGRLLLLPALRQEFYHNRLRSDTTGAGLSLDNDSPFTGQLSLRHAATDAVTLKASYGTYYHPPDFTELFGDRGSVIGNDRLEPEKGVNIDAGVRLAHRAEAKPVQVWTEVVRFRTSADDLIQYVFDARGIGRPVNVGEARIDGWELSCGVDLAEHVRISHGTTLQEAENRSGLPGQDGNHLPLRARRKHVIRVEPYGKRWRAWLEWSRLGKRHLDTANLVEMEEQEIVNAGVALTWRSLKLSLEVRNVGDEQVSDIGGYPLPGRLVLGAVEYSF